MHPLVGRDLALVAEEGHRPEGGLVQQAKHDDSHASRERWQQRHVVLGQSLVLHAQEARLRTADRNPCNERKHGDAGAHFLRPH